MDSSLIKQPAVVCRDFVSGEEIDDIWHTLQSNADQWIKIDDVHRYDNLNITLREAHDKLLMCGVNINVHKPYYMGPAFYFTEQAGVENYKRLAKQYNQIMHDLFYDHYVHLRETLSEYMGFPCSYHETPSLPGFHIFGPGLEHPVKYGYFKYHHDKLEGVGREILKTNVVIESFTLPLINPVGGSSLEWIDENNNERKLHYIPGTLYHWPGNLTHRIGHFTLKEHEWRLTFQAHVAHNNREGVIFW